MTQFNRLVVNGDSYMAMYAQGSGHVDLAQRLGIETAVSLAIGGSPDTRLIRTCLKDSYLTTDPTFYVIGIGFLSRWEVPVLKNDFDDTFNGRWTNPQNQDFVDRWEHNWGRKETEQLMDLKLKSDFYSVPDRLEDLMYRLIAMISDLHRRGHRVLIYQQADDIYQRYLDRDSMRLFKNNPVFIEGLTWLSVPWQLKQGIPPNPLPANSPYEVPDNIRHPMAGRHELLNKFLHQYIVEHNILA
jgi:hypothetical protein